MPSIVICGAGPGLGRSVARRYGREGHDVVLVARRAEPLESTAAELRNEGITAHAVPADLGDPAAMGDLAGRIRQAVGDPDVLYYAPVSAGMAFVPATQLTTDAVAGNSRLLLGSLTALVGEFLPHLIEQHAGAILTAQGATALTGRPGMSGPGPAMAAQRNYLQALEKEVADSGVFVGRLYVSALIKNSAIDQAMQKERAATGGRALPAAALIDPDVLADKLWKMHHSGRPHEAVAPAWGRIVFPLTSSAPIRRLMAKRTPSPA